MTQPDVYQRLLAGIDQMVEAVRPAFGPLHGTVMLERIGKTRLPEILDGGGVISRRIVMIPDRDEDVGAMMVRHLMWRVHDKHGDAATTAALLYRAVFARGVRHVLNGGNAMLLRQHLQRAALLVHEALKKQALPVESAAQLVNLAKSLTIDPELAERCAEAVFGAGRGGQVSVKQAQGRDSSVQLIQGMTWKGEFFSRQMVADKFANRSEMEDVSILISNFHLTDPYALARFLAMVSQAGIRRLLVLAKEASQDCIAVMEAARRDPAAFDLIAVKLWETTERWELKDLAVLTGGQMFPREAGLNLGQVRSQDLGQAGRLWVERGRFGLLSGGGDEAAIAAHAQAMRRAVESARDVRFARRLKERLAGFHENSAVCLVGGDTQVQAEARVELAKQLITILQGAMSEGLIAGGGAALLACRSLLERMSRADDESERAAGRIVCEALEVPARILIENSGRSASAILARITAAGMGWGYDVLRGEVRNMAEAGILDSAGALQAAAYGAISNAALGLTVDTIVHPRKRKESVTTG